MNKTVRNFLVGAFAVGAVGTSAVYLTVESGNGRRSDSFKPTSANSYFIVGASGGVVWDDNYLNMITNWSDSALFKEFCNAHKVVCLIIDVQDPETGASLFTYKVGKNGHAGTGYISRHGLNQSQRESMLEYEAKLNAMYRKNPNTTDGDVFLLRKDGSVVGRYTPYCSNGKYDCAESVWRLAEMAEMLSDPNEESNNSVATTKMIVDCNGEEVTGTFCICDRTDCYCLITPPSDSKIKVVLTGDSRCSALASANLACALVKFDGEHQTVINPIADRTWQLSESDVENEIYVVVTAFDDVTASSTIISSAKVGGSIFGYTMKVIAE